MLVGNTGGGKTRVYETLQKTFITMRERDDPNQGFQHVTTKVLNPKAISMGEMYGEVNAVS
jgi:dynein heavy chain